MHGYVRRCTQAVPLRHAAAGAYQWGRGAAHSVVWSHVAVPRVLWTAACAISVQVCVRGLALRNAWWAAGAPAHTSRRTMPVALAIAVGRGCHTTRVCRVAIKEVVLRTVVCMCLRTQSLVIVVTVTMHHAVGGRAASALTHVVRRAALV